MGTAARTVYSAANSIPTNARTHVVGTYDGTRMRLYLNGIQVNSLAITGKINSHAEPLRIGGDPKGDFFKGMIDEVNIYNKALTAAEVLSRYEEAIIPNDSDEVPDYIEELFGTDKNKDDTDGDGLSDYIEIFITHTDPTVTDTDGITLDSQRIFTQQVSTDNISENLLTEENAAVPCLTVTVAGNVNKTVKIAETGSVEFSDSRAIVGLPLDIKEFRHAFS